MSRPRLFLSAVSEELRIASSGRSRPSFAPWVRSRLAGRLPHGVRRIAPVATRADRLQRGSDPAHGEGYGAEPPEADPDYGRVSYTQFEFLYASQRQEDLDHRHRRTMPPRQAARPARPAARLRPDPAGYQAERLGSSRTTSPGSHGRITSAIPRTPTPSCRTSSCACAMSWGSCGGSLARYVRGNPR